MAKSIKTTGLSTKTLQRVISQSVRIALQSLSDGSSTYRRKGFSMRHCHVKPRSTATIVQQMNTISTRAALRAVAQGKSIDIPQGSTPRTYDFDDQSKVDFDKPLFGHMSNPMYDGFENLIDQHLNAGKISEHLHPTPPPPVETLSSPVDPPTPPTE